MSFGGFLGMGDSYHPLPWHVLTYDTGQGGYVVDLDRSRLGGAPTLRHGRDAELERSPLGPAGARLLRHASVLGVRRRSRGGGLRRPAPPFSNCLAPSNAAAHDCERYRQIGIKQPRSLPLRSVSLITVADLVAGHAPSLPVGTRGEIKTLPLPSRRTPNCPAQDRIGGPLEKETDMSRHVLITGAIMLAITGPAFADCNQEILEPRRGCDPGGDRREHRRRAARNSAPGGGDRRQPGGGRGC